MMLNAVLCKAEIHLPSCIHANPVYLACGTKDEIQHYNVANSVFSPAIISQTGIKYILSSSRLVYFTHTF